MAVFGKLTVDMFITNMPYAAWRKITMMMDQGSAMRDWETLAGSIVDPRTNVNRYSITDIGNFKLEFKRGNSPTGAVLRDWGTQNATVGQLLQVLREIQRVDVIHEIMPDYQVDQARAKYPQEVVNHNCNCAIAQEENGYSNMVTNEEGLLVRQLKQLKGHGIPEEEDDSEDEDRGQSDQNVDPAEIHQCDEIVDDSQMNGQRDQIVDDPAHIGQLDNQIFDDQQMGLRDQIVDGHDSPDILPEFGHLHLNDSFNNVL